MDQEVLSQLLPVGTILENRYRIDRYLSSGGFGNTYLARDTKLDCIVAIKEFFLKEHSSRCADGRTVQNTTPTSRKLFHDYQEKFVTEAKRITQLHSDHIVRVIDLLSYRDDMDKVDETRTGNIQSSYVDLQELIEEAKTYGDGWTEEEWKAMFKDAMKAAKPMMTEMADMQKKLEEAMTKGDEAAAKKLMEDMENIGKKYEDVQKQLEEFEKITDKNPIAKKLNNDEAFQKEVAKELGMEEFMDM